MMLKGGRLALQRRERGISVQDTFESKAHREKRSEEKFAISLMTRSGSERGRRGKEVNPDIPE